MSNVISYNPFTFTDAEIISGNAVLSNAMMFDSLNPDELSVDVYCDETGNAKLLTNSLAWYHTVDNRGYVVAQNDIRNFTYGDPISYYNDGILVGKFYIKSVTRLSINRFRLNAISAAGIWASITNMGGVYSGETAGTVIASLLSGFTYSIDADVANVPLYGYLPIASIRDNLQQILFVLGASLMKDQNGNPHIKFLSGATPIPIGDERIFLGATLDYKTPATEVIVTEHSYYQSSYDVEVSLFDNTDGGGTVTHKLVTFSDPCHTLAVTGTLTIDDSGNDCGANYAYVTGIGTLTGKKYTHTTRVFSVPTTASGEARSAKVEKATLVSAANSANVAARVSDYEGHAEIVSCRLSLEDDSIKPATLIEFNDPYGEHTEGFISEMDIKMSGKTVADCQVVKNYTPAHFGNNFTDYDLITFDTPTGTYTVKKTGTIRVVLAQGGQAGEGGQGGADATCSTAGTGGSAGQGGAPGKVFVIDLDVTQGDTFSYAVGDQGMGSAGGASGGGMGSIGDEGEHSTFGSYTSADGAIPPNGYINILSGDVYSEYGLPGIPGGNGGLRDDGEDVTFNGQTWRGGWALGSYTDSRKGGGGGAAYGADGHNSQYDNDGYYRGGAGADAEQLEIDATPGSGGRGGCGGGGGGSGGLDGSICWSTSPGKGGNGSGGYYGGFGYIIVYY